MSNIGVIVPIVALCIPIVSLITRHQRKMAEIQANTTAEKAALYATGNAELEQRVRVLERIITDGGYDTALQIEALRDQREVEAVRTPAETRQ